MPTDTRRLPVPENSKPPCVFLSVTATAIVKPFYIVFLLFLWNELTTAVTDAVSLFLSVFATVLLPYT